MNWVEIIFWLCCFLVMYTYILYPALLLGLSIFRRKYRRVDEDYFPTVSLLIAAYNEEAVIAEKMKNCLALDYPKDKLEVLVGSDGSDDQTNAIVANYSQDRIKLFPFQQRRGKAAVLNDIAAAAQGEILIFSDANSMYRRDAVVRLAPHFADSKVGGVCGRLVLLSEAHQIDAEGERFYWDYENYLKHLEGKLKTVFGANGAIYAIRRHLFQALPSHKVVADDFLIPLKVVESGYDVVYDKDAVACEFAAENLSAEFKRKVRIGAGNFHGIREILPLLNPRRGFVAFGLWSHKIIRWLVPFFLLTIFGANFALLGRLVYDVLFVLQLFFYGVAFMSWQLDRRGTQLPILIYPYYFVTVNIALLLGFFKFLTGSQKPAWARTER